ncbi:MAG: hypothetical protein HXX13_05675 [Bacteroidetes bacterium]|nr:hypothetical protein [Bacteroidota bacterium]
MDLQSSKDPILFATFNITSADTDMESRLRPGALLNFLIQSAIQSADSLGFGFGSLRGEKLFWVLSRMTIRIMRPLKWYENITVETWPKDVDGLMYLRDFIIRDKNNEIVAVATSGWLAVNWETKRPGKIEGIDGLILDRLKSSHAIEEHPEKLKAVDSEVISERLVTYFDIDLNRHVTSTRYLDWMMDALPVEFNRAWYPCQISINYMKETQLGSNISIACRKDNLTVFSFEGMNKKNSLVSFRGKIEFSSVSN